MLKTITSRDNAVLKLARSLHKKRGREKSGRYFAEGVRLVNDVISFVPKQIDCIIVSEKFFSENRDFINTLDKDGKFVYSTSDKAFREICDTETPQGIAAVLKLPPEGEVDFGKMEYVLALDGVSEPGNMGTIIRTAEAAGIECICLSRGCADIYSPKVVRSAMGSVFRMRFCKFDTDTVKELKSAGFKIAATALYNSMPIENAGLKGKRAIVIGNEAHGVSPEVLAESDVAVRIEMKGDAESLNAAVAAGIAMYMLRP